MKRKSRKRLVPILVIAVIAIILIIWIVYPKAKVTTDSEGNKTIETPRQAPTTDLKEATTDVQEKFTTSDVKVVNTNGFTITSGNIINKDSKKHDISVQVNFYNDKNRIAGSANTLITEIATGETRNFSMNTMGDLTGNKYEVKVEFIN